TSDTNWSMAPVMLVKSCIVRFGSPFLICDVTVGTTTAAMMATSAIVTRTSGRVNPPARPKRDFDIAMSELRLDGHEQNAKTVGRRRLEPERPLRGVAVVDERVERQPR